MGYQDRVVRDPVGMAAGVNIFGVNHLAHGIDDFHIILSQCVVGVFHLEFWICAGTGKEIACNSADLIGINFKKLYIFMFDFFGEFP